MKTPALMIQGTGSDVGKSLIVAGLCRALTRRGLKVRPFKAQNMSNNAAVTAEGGEIGRAQALQALACGLAPSIDMNPVLLKPQSETGAQIILQGRLWGAAQARDYASLKRSLMPQVLESFHRLAAGADIVLVEGAGGAAETNLRDGDIANMGFAEAADLPVVLVGDIERGGVIASMLGTHALLDPADRARLKGYIVNKFRGDPALFESAVATLAERTHLPCLGIVPYLAAARRLPAEDSVALDSRPYDGARRADAIKIAVPRLPRIANFDDLDPLAAEPGIVLDLVEPGRALPGDAALILLPGSKATLADLAFLRSEGWDIDLVAHRRRGGRILGLCGGYQMLGTRIADPQGIEGPPGEAAGLGLLAVETVLGGDKTLRQRRGTAAPQRIPLQGYEMHVGATTGPATARPFVAFEEGDADGAISEDGRVAGCYLHGLFAGDAFRRLFLAALGAAPDPAFEHGAAVEAALDALAAHLERHLDVGRILEIANGR
jgi:adenosylcobyric acid synthase